LASPEELAELYSTWKRKLSFWKIWDQETSEAHRDQFTFREKSLETMSAKHREVYKFILNKMSATK